eukprot:s1286_g15.t1
MSKRQASLESDVSKRHSSLEASLEASKGASQVSRSLEVALDRMEERILQRYSNLEEAVSRKGALDEAMTVTLRPRAANQKARVDPTMIGAMRTRATASRPARAGASPPPMILMVVESLAGSLAESPLARVKARARVATTEVQVLLRFPDALRSVCIK